MQVQLCDLCVAPTIKMLLYQMKEETHRHFLPFLSPHFHSSHLWKASPAW